VIPTFNARDVLAEALASVAGQADVVVVDNGSSDGTAAMVAERFPRVRLVRLETNLGFGRAINRVALTLDHDALVLVNNDTVCSPDFVERICAPLADPGVGMVAGVLVQARQPDRVDSAGVLLDSTMRSWPYLWNAPLGDVSAAVPAPTGPCGGAAAYHMRAFQQVAGFDETLFAYWEDIDLAIRLQEAGWRCAFADDARAEHRHAATLGPRSRAQRELEAFGRGFVLGRYAPLWRRPLAAALDWPNLLTDLRRGEGYVIGARHRGIRAGRRSAAPPLQRTTPVLTLGQAVRRHLEMRRLDRARALPDYHYGAGS
jgi:GT2 family glycosyltransferase